MSNERLLAVSGEVGQVGQTLAAGEFMFQLPAGATLVYASFHTSVDDAGLTAMVQDDGVDALTAAVACNATASVGEWKSKHFGGTLDPVHIAAGSKIEIDLANAAADTRVQFVLLFLVGEA